MTSSKRGRVARRRIARQRQQAKAASEAAGSDEREEPGGGWRRLRIPDGVRRLRSRTVVLGAVAALVAGGGFYGAYEALQPAHCVDANNTVVPDDLCDDTGTGGFHWYYGGRLRSGKMTGGSVERGGFGRVFDGFHGG